MAEAKKGVCRKIDDDGMGWIDGIPFADVLPGEEIRFDPKSKKIIARDNRSPQRIQPACPYFERCGSCQFLHWSYSAQIDWKTDQVKQLFAPLTKEMVDACIGTPRNFAYRGKNILSFKSSDHKVIAGYYAARSHQLFDIESCQVSNPKAMAIFLSMKELVKQFKVEIYDEDKRKGLLRHAIIRVAETSGEILVVLVVAHSEFKGRKNFAAALVAKHPEITTIVENINIRSTSIVLGTQERTIYGKGYIVDKLGEYTFKISARSFYQVHPTQTEILYDTALKGAALRQSDILLDAYSGVGTIGIYASKYVKEVLCIESNSDATEDARSNGRHNHVSNVRFICSDFAQWLLDTTRPQMKFDVVVMDPPREGSDKNFLLALRKLQPRTIVYISCNPETQARDVKELLIGYDIA
ncbi:MAG: 23S rRNA (uracil(1939)-C(5))-methyltransferase RlmD, partial [Erysipelotrichales bacterium]